MELGKGFPKDFYEEGACLPICLPLNSFYQLVCFIQRVKNGQGHLHLALYKMWPYVRTDYKVHTGLERHESPKFTTSSWDYSCWSFLYSIIISEIWHHGATPRKEKCHRHVVSFVLRLRRALHLLPGMLMQNTSTVQETLNRCCVFPCLH